MTLFEHRIDVGIVKVPGCLSLNLAIGDAVERMLLARRS